MPYCNPEVEDKTRLSGQRAPGLHLSPQLWDDKHGTPCLVSYVAIRYRTQVCVLVGQGIYLIWLILDFFVVFAFAFAFFVSLFVFAPVLFGNQLGPLHTISSI